jgi:nucleotidyltransferase-like protein
MSTADWAPPHARPLAEAVIAATRADPRIVGLTANGSAATGTMDEFSDLDFVVVCQDEDQPGVLRNAPRFAARLAPLLACYNGEHMGEPRLLACGYRPAAERRLEQIAPGLVPELAATVGDYTPQGCAAALRAAAGLYRRLCDETPSLVRRAGVEAVSLDYLAQIEARIPPSGDQ